MRINLLVKQPIRETLSLVTLVEIEVRLQFYVLDSSRKWAAQYFLAQVL